MPDASEFTLALKSTIDKHGVDMANSLGVSNFVDIDDTVNAAVKLQSEEDCITWQFHSMDEDPIDPLYTVIFMVGAKTTLDPSNYTMMDFISRVKDTFKIRSRIEIYNYSARVAGALAGDMFIIQSGIDAQDFDKESGYRFVSVVAKIVRKVG